MSGSNLAIRESDHRSTVYRLLKRVKREGEHALVERRHGHPTKLRGEVLTFLLDYCQNYASVASREVQRLVAERFGLSVSVSQLNRVRAAHGLSRKNPPREKNYIGNLSLRKYQERERSEQVFSCSLFPNGYSPPEFSCWETLASLFSTGYNHPERAVGKHKGN